MRKRTRVGQRHLSSDEVYDQIKRLAWAVDRQGGERGALKAAVEAVNDKISEDGPKLHYVNAHRWMRAWRLIERRRKESGLLREWLRELGSSRVFHLAALEDPIQARRDDRLPGSRRALTAMSEAEIRKTIQDRGRSKQVRANPKRKPMGRKQVPADVLAKAIEALLGAWKCVRGVLPRAATGPIDELADLKPTVRDLVRLTKKLKVLVGLESLVAAPGRGRRTSP